MVNRRGNSNYCNMALIYSWCLFSKQKGVLRNSTYLVAKKRQYCTPNNHLSEEFCIAGSKHLDLLKKIFEIVTKMNELILFCDCPFEVQCDINCGNDTVDCLAKKVPSNQKLDMASGVLLGLLGPHIGGCFITTCHNELYTFLHCP